LSTSASTLTGARYVINSLSQGFATCVVEGDTIRPHKPNRSMYCDMPSAAMSLGMPMRFQCEHPDIIRAKPPISGGIPPFWYIWEEQSGNEVVLSDTFAANPALVGLNTSDTTQFRYKLTVIDNSDPPNIATQTYNQIITPEIAETFYSFDLWSRDDVLDVGNEPNQNSFNIWYSPDLWFRKSDSSAVPSEPHGHEEPVLGQHGYLHVQFYNRGCVAYTRVTVKHSQNHLDSILQTPDSQPFTCENYTL